MLELEVVDGLLANYSQKHDKPVIDDRGTRVITVRMPRELHRRLAEVAHEKKTSVNRLACAVLDGVKLPDPPPPVVEELPAPEAGATEPELANA
jgi:hypothetical protein